MKAKIGPYRDWIGPYQIAEAIFFWVKKYDKDYNYTEAYNKVHEFGRWLSEDKNGNDSYLTTFCNWIHGKKKRVVDIKTDPWDHWNAGITMAMLCLPILKDLREHRTGTPWTEHADGPWYYRFLREEDEHAWDERGSYCDERWRWIMDEIIWSLEQIAGDRDWEEAYTHGFSDIVWEPCEDNPKLCKMGRGPNDTWWWDQSGHIKHQEKIRNGLRLLGRYWESMWD